MSEHTEKEKKPIYKKWWFWLTVFVVIAGVGGISQNSNEINTASTLPQENTTIEKQETEEEKAKRLENERIEREQQETNFKTECKEYTFEQLARNPENVKGQKVKLSGEVIQTAESSWSNAIDLRINITKNEYGYYSDTIYATYTLPEGNDKVLENDIVTIWGTSEGDYSYTSVLGSKVTLPRINISYLQIQK